MPGPGPALPQTFLPAEGGSDTLALVFPGLAYRSTLPLLHYAQRALEWRGDLRATAAAVRAYAAGLEAFLSRVVPRGD